MNTSCLSKVEIINGFEKRCIRDAGHIENCIWVESETKADGLPWLIKWDKNNPTKPRYFSYKLVGGL